MENPTPKRTEGIVPVIKFPIAREFELQFPLEERIMNFSEVLKLRRSSRDFGSISIEILSEILFLSAHVKHGFSNSFGNSLSYRPSPSAGARHPVEILICSIPIFKNERLFRYDPFNHRIQELALDEEICIKLRLHISESFPQSELATIIWFLAFPDKTSAKYENAESLIWRDIGTLANTIQLCCTFLGLNSCISGTLGYPYFAQLFNEYKTLSGGAILVGTHPKK